MSAFVVSKAHIDALIRVGLEGPADRATRYPGNGWSGVYWFDPQSGPRGVSRQLTHEIADEVGAMLVLENVRSVQYRYQDGSLDNLPGPTSPYYTNPYAYPLHGTGPIRIGQAPRRLTAVEALKAIDCYEYQSCEHPEWHGSEARRLCDALRQRLIGALTGYDEAPWEVTG